MTLTKREKFLIVFGLIVVTVAVYVMYFLMPYLQNTSDAKQRLTSAQSRLNVLNMQASKIGSMKDSIAELESNLKEKGATVATGIDHAKILLYLENLVKGRAKGISIQAPADQEQAGKFQTQHIAIDFHTSWKEYVAIMDDLKNNELYNQVAYIQAEYRKPESQQAPVTTSPESTTPADATATPAPAALPDNQVIYVHLELVFYAFELPEGQQLEPPLTPTEADRKLTLFPAK